MKKYAYVTLLTILLSACVLSPPEGTKELELDMLRDQAGRDLMAAEPLTGRPLYLKVRAYPQVKSANIYGRHWLLIMAKRENVDFGGLERRLEEE